MNGYKNNETKSDQWRNGITKLLNKRVNEWIDKKLENSYDEWMNIKNGWITE